MLLLLLYVLLTYNNNLILFIATTLHAETMCNGMHAELN